MQFWALGCFDLGLSEDRLWELTFGQFYKLTDRLVTTSYFERYDISALHASLINLNTKGKRYSAKTFIGSMPILSDQKESVIQGNAIRDAFKAIFPEKSGVVGQGKIRVERIITPKEG